MGNIHDEEKFTSNALVPISFEELSAIVGGTSDIEQSVDDKGKGQDSGHAGGFFCWC